MRRLIDFILCYIQSITEDLLGIRAAALAYYAVFSIFPLMLLLISIAGFLLTDLDRQDELFEAINAVASLIPGGAELLLDTVSGVVGARGSLGILGIIGLLWSASGFFRSLEVSVHAIFGIGTQRPMWKSRGIGLLMAALVAPMFLLASILSVLGNVFVQRLMLPGWIEQFVNQTSSQAAFLLISALAFTLVFRFIPSEWPSMRYALLGGVVGSISWGILTLAFNWYLNSGFADYNVIYGSIGAVIALLLWLYLTSFIILLGAELTAHLAKSKDCNPPELPPQVEKYIETL